MTVVGGRVVYEVKWESEWQIGRTQSRVEGYCISSYSLFPIPYLFPISSFTYGLAYRLSDALGD